jgi:hypothetical protein
MTGVSVTETSIEASKATIYAMASGSISRPSIPGRKNSGTRTNTMITVA